MRRVTRISSMASLLVALLLAALSSASAAAQGGGAAGEVLTNESIVQMVTGKVPKDLVMTKIRTTKSTFDLTPAGLINLTASKVPNDMIKAMMTSAPAGAREKELLNNDAIIRMVNGQVARDIMITKIQGSRPDYDLTTAGIISLNQNKVSPEVIKAMMMATGSVPPPPPPAGKKPPGEGAFLGLDEPNRFARGTHGRLQWQFGRSIG